MQCLPERAVQTKATAPAVALASVAMTVTHPARSLCHFGVDYEPSRLLAGLEAVLGPAPVRAALERARSSPLTRPDTEPG